MIKIKEFFKNFKSKVPMKKEDLKHLTNGIIKENPVLRLMLGVCPAIAVTTAAINGVSMGVATMVVLICSNLVISLLRNIIPDKFRVPAHISIIALFVTAVQILVKTFLPSVDAALGIYLPLIVVNCIILSRAETFASKNSVLPSVLDGIGMGIGFTATLTVMGIIRELIGAGTIFNFPVTLRFVDPMIVMLLPPGGFFLLGILIAVLNKFLGKKATEQFGCDACNSGGEQ